MPSLAGKPPFATDESDSFYETGPTPRQPQQKFHIPSPAEERMNANKRSSAYDVYDNYVSGPSASSSNLNAPPLSTSGNRTSGIGAMMMNFEDDSEDESEESPHRPPGISTSTPSKAQGKNAALAAATGVSPAATSPLHNPFNSPMVPQSQNPFANPPPQQPQPMMKPIAAPQPGYAAPIAALNNVNMNNFDRAANGMNVNTGAMSVPQPAMMREAHPQPGVNMPMPVTMPSAGPGGPGPRVPLSINTSAPLRNPFDFEPPASPFVMNGARGHSPAPHPLQPPITPILPAFIRPMKSGVPAPVAISFDESGLRRGTGEKGKGSMDSVEAIPRKRIMRGDGEETLLPKRGERGDDFWRRFSMVVKEEKKESSWLHDTRNNTSRYSKWVWFCGMFLLLIIGGAIGLGVYLTRNAPSHQQPKVFGGSGDNENVPDSNSGSTVVADGRSATIVGGKTVFHVSPTNTVERRWDDAFSGVVPTPTALVERSSGNVTWKESKVKRGKSTVHLKKNRLRLGGVGVLMG